MFRQNLAAPFVSVAEQDGVTKPRPFETKGKAPDTAAQVNVPHHCAYHSEKGRMVSVVVVMVVTP